MENNILRLNEINEDTFLQNFIAQGSSRYVLYNINEPQENFPKYAVNLNSKLNSIALEYLSLGCSLIENKELNNPDYIKKAVEAIEKGAEILEGVHVPKQNREAYSLYYILISALAYYSSYQYSKAFILFKKVELELEIGKLVSLFLKKDFKGLIKIINSIILNDTYSDDEIYKLESDDEVSSRIYIVLFARVFLMVLEFIYSGDKKRLDEAKQISINLKELALIDKDPAIWWIARFLIIILDGLIDSSLWGLVSRFKNNQKNNGDIIKKYILGLAFRKVPNIELFISQREALEKIMSPKGAVVSMPTSAGKTRIAEIAIIYSLIDNPNSTVLYLAPFKSLAFEIEDVFEQSFTHLNYQISHLYGGQLFSKIDKITIENSQIIIATPEKAKAILRANKEILNNIKLIIIDEGHLIGEEPRETFNEIFIEELKMYNEDNQGKIILLSAMIPNAEILSQWITNDDNHFTHSVWRPSTQRFGVLEWNGKNVNITWIDETFETYNNNFIKPFKIDKSKKQLPSDKAEAIAATALKLSKDGTVLVFVGRANMVHNYAARIFEAMGNAPKLHEWKNQKDFEAFELSCEEEYGSDSEVLKFSKYGIICHSNNLSPEMRFTTEKLLRYGDPLIIIATSTLGQGVNLGVSSVIIANEYISDKKISKRDFMNIAGRAGRAFTDSDGKILYAVDTKGKDSIKERKRVAEYLKNIREGIEKIGSGFLKKIRRIKQISIECNIEFDLLLQLIAENNFSSFQNSRGDSFESEVNDVFDYIDDTLLSIDSILNNQDRSDHLQKLDDYIRKSLAYIQAKTESEEQAQEVLSIIKARNEGIIKITQEDIDWKSLVASGIPLRTGIFIKEKQNDILDFISSYNNSEKKLADLIILFKNVEGLIKQFPSKNVKADYEKFDKLKLDSFRELWLKGVSVSKINNTIGKVDRKEPYALFKNFFSFNLPWVLNGIARILFNLGFKNESDALEEITILSELGLPNILAAKIYLAGIKSRSSAAEISLAISTMGNINILEIKETRRYIIKNIDVIEGKCSDSTKKWLEMLKEYDIFLKNDKEVIEEVNINNINSTAKILYLRSYNNQLFLCSPDYKEKIKISNEVILNDKIIDNLGVFFEYDHIQRQFEIKTRNPYLKLN